MAATKRKRVSKKNKKSWRKNVNIDDVEDFLEEKRFEERTGHYVNDLTNDELFEISAKGGHEQLSGPSAVQLHESGQNEGDTNKSKFRLTETRTPKCFAILDKRSKVSDPLIKRNKIKTRSEKRPLAVKNRLQEKLKKRILAIKGRKLKKSLTKIPSFDRDLWGKENSKDVYKYSEWLSNDTVRHTLTNTGEMNKRIPKSITNKTSLLPAVEVPHPGMSYNPSLKDHNDIINKVVAEEKKIVEEEKRLKKATTDMFSKVTREAAEKEWIKEMSAGLVVTKDDEDDDADGEEYRTVNPPVKNKKKTLQKRRRKREANQLRGESKIKKIEKKKLFDLCRLRSLNSDIKRKETALEKAKKKREERLEKKRPFATKKLSRTKYEEPQTDFTPIQDLSGNLRGLKTETNLLMDRFKSLQKRNILEPTVKQFPKKGKKKRYERESTKMGWEPKGY